MKLGEEKLVENFAELKTGMIIVYRPCLHCGARHQTQLGNFVAGIRGLTPAGDWTEGVGFKVFVQPPCMKLAFLITPKAVEQRLIYRVEDGVDQVHASRRREHVPSNDNRFEDLKLK